MASVLPILQSLIIILGTLAGTWWGARLSRGKEERQWQRDRWLEIYADIAKVHSSLLVEGAKVYSDPDRDNVDANKLVELTVEFDRICNKGILIAPEKTQQIIMAYLDLIFESCDRARDKNVVPKEQWEALLQKQFKIAKTFVIAARSDLGADPPNTNFWQTFRKPRNKRRH